MCTALEYCNRKNVSTYSKPQSLSEVFVRADGDAKTKEKIEFDYDRIYQASYFSWKKVGIFKNLQLFV